jgi:hypothetical protein
VNDATAMALTSDSYVVIARLGIARVNADQDAIALANGTNAARHPSGRNERVRGVYQLSVVGYVAYDRVIVRHATDRSDRADQVAGVSARREPMATHCALLKRRLTCGADVKFGWALFRSEDVIL